MRRIRLSYLDPGCDAMLNHAVVAGCHVALAEVVALEDHRRLVEIEAVLQHSVLVIPAPVMFNYISKPEAFSCSWKDYCKALLFQRSQRPLKKSYG
jgi:hypothetical protein